MKYFSRAAVQLFGKISTRFELVFALYEKNGYTGPICILRRSGDNVEATFYQGATAGTLNTVRGGSGTDLLTWVYQGSGTGAAYGKQWYDQSGKNNHLTQTSTANQYFLVDAGAYVTIGTNNRPCWKSNGNGQWNLTNTVNISTLDFTVIDVKRNEFANQYVSSLAHSANGTPYFNYKYSDNNIYMHDNTGYVNGAVADGTTAHTYTGTKRSGTMKIYKETTLVSGTKTTGAGVSTIVNNIGNRAGEKQASFFAELVMQLGTAWDYTNEQTSIRTYYGT